ncbi:MAG: DUF2860 family protein [Marinobacter sp.]|uniref:DUF2860 family protein n=1 Tax=Marinobacter sp. TaxID=50741 RepID=UPI00396E678D
MKRYLALSSLVIALPGYAQLAPEQGISGEVSLNAFGTSSASNFNTDGNATITSLENKAQSESESLIAPPGNIAYTFGKELAQQIYFGTTRSAGSIFWGGKAWC